MQNLARSAEFCTLGLADYLLGKKTGTAKKCAPPGQRDGAPHFQSALVRSVAVDVAVCADAEIAVGFDCRQRFHITRYAGPIVG